MTDKPSIPAGRVDCRCPQAKHLHGTLAAYRSDRCRCFPCRLARAQARIEGHQADHVLVDSIGVQRRLQALATLGWGPYKLAAELGVSNTAVEHWRSGKYPTVRPETVLKVAALYDRLWDQTATSYGARAARGHAARMGWLPPLAWDDDTIDDPAAGPAVVDVQPRELHPCGTPAAYRRHRRRGETPDLACREAERISRAERRVA